jgi:hypothetical protein
LEKQNNKTSKIAWHHGHSSSIGEIG